MPSRGKANQKCKGLPVGEEGQGVLLLHLTRSHRDADVHGASDQPRRAADNLRK